MPSSARSARYRAARCRRTARPAHPAPAARRRASAAASSSAQTSATRSPLPSAWTARANAVTSSARRPDRRATGRRALGKPIHTAFVRRPFGAGSGHRHALSSLRRGSYRGLRGIRRLRTQFGQASCRRQFAADARSRAAGPAPRLPSSSWRHIRPPACGSGWRHSPPPRACPPPCRRRPGPRPDPPASIGTPSLAKLKWSER